MPQLPVVYKWTGTPPDPLAHPDLYDGLIWRRLAAYFFDAAIIGLLLLAGWFSLMILGVLSFGLLLPLVPVLVALIPIAYHAIQVGGRQHATFGMRLRSRGPHMDRRRPGYRPGLPDGRAVLRHPGLHLSADPAGSTVQRPAPYRA